MAAAEKQLEFQSRLLRTIKRRFEQGDQQIEEFVKAEQPVADIEAKIQQLKLLLEMYRTLGTEQPQSDSQPPAESETD